MTVYRSDREGVFDEYSDDDEPAREPVVARDLTRVPIAELEVSVERLIGYDRREQLRQVLDESLVDWANARELVRRHRDLVTLVENAAYSGGGQHVDANGYLRDWCDARETGRRITGPGRCEKCGLFLQRRGAVARCPVHGGEFRD